MPRATHRIAILAAGAALVLLALAPAALPGHHARAADRGLVVIAQTRYVALAEQRRVHVTIDAVATSYTPNPADGLAYYPDVSFAIQTGATHVAATSGGTQLAVSVDAHDPDFQTVTVTFQEGVFFEESYPYQVTYDLPDPGGAPDRNVRISPSIIAFPIWAFGSSNEPGGSVTVVLPSGFRPGVQGAALKTTTGPNGEIVLATSSLPDPFAFFAYLSADRPGAFADTNLTIDVGGTQAGLRIRAWQDDPEWGTAMSTLMTTGLPALQHMIGLPYPAPGTLIIEEAATSRLGEYAGIYNNLTGTIRVRYDADGYVGLHEAAHLWFNAKLFPDRWIGEAYAEFYGVQAAKSIGASGSEFNLTDDMLPNRIALNDWGVIGAVDSNVEEFAYAASYNVAKLVFERTNIGGLQAVWRSVEGREMAYQPAHGNGSPELGVDAQLPGWEQLLDLLDERTAANFDDIWTDWVVNDQQQQLMDQRTAARQQYETVLGHAGEWNLPQDLRLAMGAWQFDKAEAELGVAQTVLTERDSIATKADALHLMPSIALQQTFERSGGLAPAKQKADAEIYVLAGIADATERIGEQESLLEAIGLIGEDPQANLHEARTAFEHDLLDTAAARARSALEARVGAENAGQTRVLVGGGSILLVGGGTFVALRFGWRRGARGERAVASAPAPVPEDAVPVEALRANEEAEPPAQPLDPTA